MLHGNGRNALLKAAAEAIADRGIDAVTTRDVCARAGVQAPALYHHFGTKQQLLELVLAEAFDRYLAGKAELLVTGDPVRDTCAGWDNHVEFARTNPALYPLMLQQGSRTSEASLDVLRSGFDQLAKAGALCDGVTPGLATAVLSSALRGISARVCQQPDNADLARASELLRNAVVTSLIVPRKEQL